MQTPKYAHYTKQSNTTVLLCRHQYHINIHMSNMFRWCRDILYSDDIEWSCDTSSEYAIFCFGFECSHQLSFESVIQTVLSKTIETLWHIINNKAGGIWKYVKKKTETEKEKKKEKTKEKSKKRNNYSI